MPLVRERFRTRYGHKLTGIAPDADEKQSLEMFREEKYGNTKAEDKKMDKRSLPLDAVVNIRQLVDKRLSPRADFRTADAFRSAQAKGGNIYTRDRRLMVYIQLFMHAVQGKLSKHRDDIELT